MKNLKIKKTRALHIVPYSNLYPPMNGGQLRCFHLMDKLSMHIQLDVLSYQSPSSFFDKGYTNKNISFYSPNSFIKTEGIFKYFPKKIKNAIRYRWLTKTFFETATLEVLDFQHIIKELYKKNTYDWIIFEHLSAMSLVPIIKQYFPKAKYVLDAHNVDHLLVIPAQSNRKYYKKIKILESTLYKYVDEFWACSKNDVDILEHLNENKIVGKVVPNGVDMQVKCYVEDKSDTYNTILFCGTLDAYPNAEGILWFYKEVWLRVKENRPEVKLLIVGKGDRAPFKVLEMDSQIDFVGEVNDVAPYYKKSFMAIVPLLSGSGTRLKVLEAMSFGNPIVTTSKGIEGIDFDKDKDVLVADNEKDFALSIIKILEAPKVGEELRVNAYKLVKNKYDWSIIVNDLIEEYEI